MKYAIKNKENKTSLKVRNGIILLFLDKCQELPHSITPVKET